MMPMVLASSPSTQGVFSCGSGTRRLCVSCMYHIDGRRYDWLACMLMRSVSWW